MALLSSCEKVVEFSAGEQSPYVVLLSNPKSDSTIDVSLRYSRFFLDNRNFANIDDATMTLIANGIEYTGTRTGDGQYNIGYTVQPGDSLTLRVEVPGKETVTSSTRIPVRPDVSNVVVEDADYNEYSYSIYYNTKISFKLKDNPNERNYYRIRIFSRYKDYTWDENEATIIGEYEQANWFSCSDPVITGSTDVFNYLDNNGNFEGRELIFSDETFNGKEHEIVLTTDSYSSWIGDEEYWPLMTILVESMSRDWYLFKQTTAEQEDYIAFFAEPTQIHSNVKGGIGIFAGSSQFRYQFTREPQTEEKKRTR